MVNSESLLCLASCESVFSYCCPISHIVVDAYCLSHFYLSYYILCVYPIFTLCHDSLQRPFSIPPTIETFSDAKWCICSSPSPCPLLTLCSHSLMFFGLYVLSVWPLQPSPPHLSSSHIELYDDIKLVSLMPIIYCLFVKSPLSLFKH